MNIETKV